MIEQDSEGKGVGFERVYVFLQGFGRHVEWTANHVDLLDLCGLVGQVPRESKVPNFPLVILQENIGRLNIAMYY